MAEVREKQLEQIGREMVTAGLITDDQLGVAQETQRNLGGDLGKVLIKKGFISKEKLLDFLQLKLQIPIVSLSNVLVDPTVIKLVPSSIVQQYRFMPLFKSDDVLTIAISDPLQAFSMVVIRETLKYRLELVLAEQEEIDEKIALHYELRKKDVSTELLQVVRYGAEAADESSENLREMASGAKVIAEVNRLLQGAIAIRASDIHIEPSAGVARVRLRIDGVLEEWDLLPSSMHLPVTSRLKVMGGMDISERRVPQDGRVRLRTREGQIDLRLSAFPTMHGEKIVARLLNQNQVYNLEEIGFPEKERVLFEQLITRPYGVILVTGPTGSGKTTTLYAALQRINSQDKNIISVEDPIENEISGVNQAQVNIKAGMTFASALRSILRQDPDVIMVGEIRDHETADIALRAAITGHLVFSTLHTNTAIGAIERLKDLGVEPFLVSSGVIGIIAQRLVRRICSHCSEEEMNQEALKKRVGISAKEEVFHGKGCKKCRMTGYQGRIGIFEFVAIDNELRRMIGENAGETKLLEIALRNGTVPLYESATQLVRKGMTTIEEVLRVTESIEEQNDSFPISGS